ncbi:MAG: ABC transporter permease [Spirochaetaceae bacterium]|jgi:NitT/TauT family transport system permease protein|nr:ABC transporter permease [Spirochaetaceae bacterium]
MDTWEEDNNKRKPSLLFNLKAAFTPQGEISKKVYIAFAVFTFLTIGLLWSYLSVSGSVDPLFLPSIKKTLKAAGVMFVEQAYLFDILITIRRVMLGFIITSLVSIPFGILIGTYRPIESFFEPLFSFVRYLPVSAFIPLFILWIGIGEEQKVAVIIMGSLPPLILMVAASIKNIPSDLIQVGYTLGASRISVLWKIILPSCMPFVVDSLRMVLGWAWTYVVVAEMVGANSGIGYRIIQSQRMLNVANIFTGILCIGLIGLFFDICFKLLYKVCFPWSESAHS